MCSVPGLWPGCSSSFLRRWSFAENHDCQTENHRRHDRRDLVGRQRVRHGARRWRRHRLRQWHTPRPRFRHPLLRGWLNLRNLFNPGVDRRHRCRCCLRARVSRGWSIPTVTVTAAGGGDFDVVSLDVEFAPVAFGIQPYVGVWPQASVTVPAVTSGTVTVVLNWTNISKFVIRDVGGAGLIGPIALVIDNIVTGAGVVEPQDTIQEAFDALGEFEGESKKLDKGLRRVG